MQIGKPIKYSLAYPNGGTDPTAPGPADPATMQCDCIGFAAWADGWDRYQPGKFPLYDGYINTDSMLDEALGPGRWFSILQAPEIGCFIVGRSFKRLGRNIVGHIGVIEDVSGYTPALGLTSLGVVHCSPYNYQFTAGASAVWKTSAAIWHGYPTLHFVKFNREYAIKSHA